MSIIHEALKKAGSNKTDRLQTSVGAPGVEIRQATRRGGFNTGLLLFFAILLVTGAIVVAPLSGKLKSDWQPEVTQLTPHSATVMGPSSPDVSGQFGVEEVARHATFQLSGVVVGSGHSYGIINNQIVEQGQQISGATVRSITRKEVSLDYNGRQILLTVAE